MTRFFTSDQHWGHANIIRFSSRPYQNLHDMDKSLIANWNSVVRDGDTVYHLGDIFYKCTSTYANNVLDQLNGNIILICGNHDKIIRKNKQLRDRFERVIGWEEDILGGMSISFKPWTDQRMVMCHYKMQNWKNSHYGAWHLYGHSHTYELSCNAISTNMCVERWEYTPVHEAVLAGYLEEKMKNWDPPFGYKKQKGHVEHF